MKSVKNWKEFRADMEASLKEFCEKYECEVELGNIKYTGTNCDVPLTFKMKGAHGESAQEVDFKNNCAMFKFTPEDYMAKVCMDQKTFTFVGFNMKARKNFCILEREGKKFAAAPDTIREHLIRRK